MNNDRGKVALAPIIARINTSWDHGSRSSGRLGRTEEVSFSTFVRVGRYTLTRRVVLFFTMVVGVYLTISIANMGGYVDTIMKAEIRENFTMAMMGSKGFQKIGPDARATLLEATIAQDENRLGLNTPSSFAASATLGMR